ncbi:MAG: TonB-dependent receptor [Porphyromonas sp.]|nr:TonB-dependent receptor [Porphyromonas sp.]
MKRFKFFLALPIFILVHVVAFGQASSMGNSGKITGVITDKESKEAIPYVSVLLSSLNGEWKDAMVSNEQGEFSMSLPDKGKYKILIKCTGYESHEEELVGDASRIYSFELKPDSRELEEVVVVARRKLIKLNSSGLTYDMAKDIRSQAEDLLTALRRVPMVIVDGEGNIRVKGTSNFTIYLNGKPFRMANLNPKQVLRTISASSIERIEVITQPDASYDTEIGSTVVNIITKRKGVDGYGVYLSAGAKTQPKTEGAIAYNLVANKLKLSVGYNYEMDKHINQPIGSERQISLSNGIKNSLSTKAEATGRFIHHTGRAMLEYDIDSTNLVYADAHMQLTNTDYYGDWHKIFREGGAEKKSTISPRAYSNDGAVEANVIYRNLNKQSKKEALSVGYRFSYNPDNRNMEVVRDEDVKSFHKSTSEGGLYEHTLKADALLYGDNRTTVKAGALGVVRLSDANPRYYTKSKENEEWKALNSEGTNEIRYNHNHIAGYANASSRIGPVAVNLGARVERVLDKLIYPGREEENKQATHTNIIPRLSLSSQLSQNIQIGASYNYSIQRPSIWTLNPYVNKHDDYSVSFGNPNLTAQKSHHVEVSGMAFGENYFLNLSVDYNEVKDPVFNVAEVDPKNPSTVVKTYKNGERFRNITSSLALNYRPTSKLSTNLFLNGGHLAFYGEEGKLLQQDLIYNLSLNADWTLHEKIALGGTYMYTQASPSLGVRTKHNYSCSFYVTTKLLKDKLSVTLNVRNPFKKYNRLHTTEWGEGFEQERFNDITARSFGVKMAYNFGSGKRSTVKRNKSLMNTDLDRATGVR